MCSELTFTGHVVLHGIGIVVPQALHMRVVSLAHEGHQGVVKKRTDLEQTFRGLERIAIEREDARSVRDANLSL